MPLPFNDNASRSAQVHIFIDMDGVLADFVSHARAHGKFDAAGQTKWHELTHAWWATMPPYAGARAFYDAAAKLGTVKFLTGPSLSEECFSGKARWVQVFVPEKGKHALRDLIICSARDKHYLAGPNRVLIDDRQNNIRDWVEAGGIGIHHDGDFARTLQKLQDAVKILAAAPMPQQKPRPPGPKP